MNTIEIIKENLKAVVKGEHGEWLDENINDIKLGNGVFRCDKFTNTLCLYSEGVFYKSANDESARELKIAYSDIK